MGKHGWEGLWGGGGRYGGHSPMKSGVRQHEDIDESVRQRTVMQKPKGGVATKGRHQSYGTESKI